ncbi:MAG TPA: DNA repair protein RecO [Planctomycetota bacterium]|nr:DNA repair protein RecO [Planctomycetota bacterium]
MPYWTSLAICLRVVDYSETSQIAAFFTRDRGRLSAIAKGAKRKGSKLAGAIEPITLCEIVCFRGRDTASLHTLAELDVRETYRGVRQDLRRLHQAAYVIEVLREAAPEEQPLPDVFDLAAATLERIAKAPEVDGATVLRFEARLLDLLGLFPRLDACVECGDPAAGRAAFSARLGGVICDPCRARKDRSARDVSRGALEVLARLGGEPARAAQLRVPPGQQAELRSLLGGYLAAALDRELKLAKYL